MLPIRRRVWGLPWVLSAVVASAALAAAFRPMAEAKSPVDILKDAEERQALCDKQQRTVVDELLARTGRLGGEEARVLLKRGLDSVRTNPDIGELARIALGQRLERALRTVDTFARLPEDRPLPPPVVAPSPPPPPILPGPFSDSVTLPVEPSLRNKLEAARDYLKAGDWDQSVKLLQTVLDAREDSFYRQEHADRSGRTTERWASTRAEAARLVAALPDDAKRVYEVSYNAEARKLLADARAHNDLPALNDLVRRYQHTSAGADALSQLGSIHLDRGRSDLAAVCFQRLLQHVPPDKLPPLALFKAALAFRASGDAVREESAWNALSRRVGTAGLKLGAKEYPVEQLRRAVVLPVADRDRTADWPLFRGTAARTGRGEGDVPLLDSRCRVAAGEQASLDWLRSARPASLRVEPGGSLPLLPVAVPVASGNRLIFRGPGGVRALDSHTGLEVWHADPGLSIEGVLRDPGKKVQIDDWRSKYRALGVQAALVQNSALGTLSCDGRHVYAVEDLPLPPPPPMIVEQQSGVPRHFGPLRNLIHHNRLRALDLGTGAVVWEIGGRAGAAPAELADAYFLGPPLPVGDTLYVLVEKQADLRLLCLSPDRGTLLWAQTLATARTKLLLDVPRRLHAVHLAYRDGVLVCPTNAGAVLGVDLLSRSLLWVHAYRERLPVTPPPGEEMQPGQIPPDTFTHGYKHTAPILVGDRVVYAAPDGDSLRCLSLRDGSLLWKSARTDDDLFVGGVRDGKILIVGRSTCRALSVDKGEQLWQQATPEPAGLGAFCGKHYYLPLRDTGVLMLDPDKPNAPTHLNCRKGETKGNLVFHAGDLWSQDDSGVSAYPQLATKLAVVEAVLKRTPDDLTARLERGQLLLDKGDPAAAVVDVKKVVAGAQVAEQRKRAQAVLYVALTRLLHRDFAVGEQYLDEYRALCGSPGATISALEERRRQAGFFALLARGREGQGRLTDALQAYRDLYNTTLGGELLALPEDPAVQVRPDLWVRTHVAEMLARARPEQRTALRAEIEREAKALPADDLAALTRFAALFGAVPGPEGAAGREVRLRLAVRLAEGDDRRQVIAGLLELHALEREAGARDTAARALEARARVLAAHGLVEDATACYRTLARDFADMPLSAGRTGAKLFTDLRTDKRFLPYLEAVVPAWEGRVMTHLETKERLKSPRVVLPDGFDTFALMSDPERLRFPRTTELPPSVRDLRFVLDVSAARLRIERRWPEVELWSVPVSLDGVGAVVIAATQPPVPVTSCGHWPIGQLVIVTAGPLLFGLDLVERRVCWARNVAAEVQGPMEPGFGALGGVTVTRPDGQTTYLGMVGAPDLNGVYLQTTAGLTVLDPATGAVRWQRSDLPLYFTTFSDGTHLFLAEYYRPEGALRSVRAVRVVDGVSVPVPEGAVEAYQHKLRTVGGCILASDNGDGEPVQLRLYDVLTGKDVWRQEFPVQSIVAESVDAELLAVVTQKGEGTVIDLAARREVAKLWLDRRHLKRVKFATLLRDRTSFYLALQGDMGPDTDNVPHSLFQGELSSVPVNGRLYAFTRNTGKVRWHLDMPGQTILLDRFEELPLVLCAASFRKDKGMPNAPLFQHIRSIDKLTGKTRINREDVKLTEPFHTLRVDPRTGIIDLISDDLRWRHKPE